MILHLFNCEGCSATKTQKSDRLPDGWNYAWTRLNYWEGYSYLLCGACCYEIGKYGFFKALILKIRGRHNGTTGKKEE